MFLFRRRKPTEPAPLTEAELLARYRQHGDVQDLGRLYEPYMPLVYGVCLRYLRREDDSKDAVMQIFEKLVVDLRRHEVQHLSSWLHTTARNYCLMELRRRKSAPETLALTMPTAADVESGGAAHLFSADGEATTEEQLQQLEAGMARLPPEQYRCLDLFYRQQKSYQEIAALTGYDLPKVKSYLQNGKRNLKQYLTSPHAAR
ncbi:sigma-70 family RNA polymerase sigma factor [Hymenobacter busanensis]|uniref:Sigma-70 family RNA polymerase sigma factor n=1 Tax=Hymenobacter busanensis TaxID=2607656 RepID=A0A7L4ZXK1_9BACT|nr:sigma-70 family RNA polymerase sigma factor [Hymenobacter busanensis]KAA9333086.1 sigma-70 family RNA polymerase sigma factor [Hymenobacter busanensis]QHJ08239.1 sigma-70 family RNA polymerase sigma factor [Hymenobacter busanensis]